MAGSRGYHAYRGKNSRKKVFLAGLLVLVILAAVAVLLLQKYIVYDKTGAPRLEIPWQEETVQETEEEKVELDLVIQPAETQETLRGITVPAGPLSAAVCEAALAGDTGQNAVAVTLKDSAGTVYYDFAAASYNPANLAEDTGAAIQSLTASEMYTIARISCFHDPKAANGDVEGMGLENTGGYIFYDGNNSQWLDPAKPAARQYLCDIAKEAAELGVCEILLTDAAYPTEGKVDKIAYGEGSRNAHLQTFLQEMRAVLEPYGVKLSVEVSSDVILTGRNDLAGQALAEIALQVDRVYARVLPEAVDACKAAVEALGGETTFVPVSELADAASSENYLIP